MYVQFLKIFFLFFTECAVSVFGSSLTGFGLKDSDINLDLVIPDQVLLTVHLQYCSVSATKF